MACEYSIYDTTTRILNCELTDTKCIYDKVPYSDKCKLYDKKDQYLSKIDKQTIDHLSKLK